MQVLGILAEVEGADFGRRAAPLLPALGAILAHAAKLDAQLADEVRWHSNTVVPRRGGHLMTAQLPGAKVPADWAYRARDTVLHQLAGRSTHSAVASSRGSGSCPPAPTPCYRHLSHFAKCGGRQASHSVPPTFLPPPCPPARHPPTPACEGLGSNQVEHLCGCLAGPRGGGRGGGWGHSWRARLARSLLHTGATPEGGWVGGWVGNANRASQ